MSVKEERASPPSYLYNPEQLRRIKKKRGRNPTSLRKVVLVKNAHKAENLKRLERRRQSAVERARVTAWWKAQKAQSLKDTLSPTRTNPPSNLPPLTKVNWLCSSYFHRKKDKSKTAEHSEENKENHQSQRTTSRMPQLDIQHVEGDVIAVATDHSVIVHACNTLGAWGSGIALQLKQQFRAAYAIYAEHCKENSNDPADLLGTCLLIPPQKEDIGKSKPVWIACLFTSVGYGRGNKRTGKLGVSSKEDIIKATGPALLGMLLEWSAERERGEGDGEEVEDTPDSAIFSPRFNAGSFGVPWEKTEELIKQKWGAIEVKWTVVSREAV